MRKPDSHYVSDIEKMIFQMLSRLEEPGYIENGLKDDLQFVLAIARFLSLPDPRSGRPFLANGVYNLADVK